MKLSEQKAESSSTRSYRGQRHTHTEDVMRMQAARTDSTAQPRATPCSDDAAHPIPVCPRQGDLGVPGKRTDSAFDSWPALHCAAASILKSVTDGTKPNHKQGHN